MRAERLHATSTSMKSSKYEWSSPRIAPAQPWKGRDFAAFGLVISI